MTTTIVYPASANSLLQTGDANSTPARSLAREITQAATLAERVFATGSGSVTMTSGTFTNTPASGDVLIAVLARRADGQATITNPTGWAKLTSGATSGSRSLEVWWYRSTGVAADKGPFSWTVTSATNAWGIELLRFGGGAAFADPTVKTAATAFASTTTPAAITTTAGEGDLPGMTLNCIAVTGASLGASGIIGAFSGTATAESTTTYYDSGYGATAVTVNKPYNNAALSTTYGAAFTLGAARVGHQAQIYLEGGGRTFLGTATGYGAGINYNLATTNYPGGLAQSYLSYDTSSIPDANTVTSATLGLRALGSMLGGFYNTTDPANATLQARYYGTSISDTRGNNNSTWALSPAGMAAKTLVATYSAASAWTVGSDYTLTSNADFPGIVNKTGNTVLVLTTDDFATSTTRASRETYAFDITGTYAPLTIIHNLQAAQAISATSTTSVTFQQAARYGRKILATITGTGAILRGLGARLSTTVTGSVALTFASNVKNYAIALAASLSTVPAVVRNHGRTIIATLAGTTSTIFTTAHTRILSATISTAITLRKNRDLLLGVTNALATTITRNAVYQRAITVLTNLAPAAATRTAYNRVLATATSITSTIQRGFARTLSAAITPTPTIGKRRIAALIVQHLRGPLLALLAGPRRTNATIVSPPETTADVLTAGGTVEVLD